MTEIKEWTIRNIEALNYDDAFDMCEDSMEIKEHDVFFIDFGGYFGFSACVFCNERRIHYANDYELHHPGKSHEELKKWYIEELNNKLFTEKELSEPLKSYDEYTAKSSFLQNYYGMREHYISCFQIYRNDAERDAYRQAVSGMHFNFVCYCYHDSADFVAHCGELFDALQKAKENTVNDFDYQKNAFYHEMCNHEYCINWQGDFDVLSAFGNPKWRGEGENSLSAWFADCRFNDTQIKAYFAARADYNKAANENGWY